MNGSNRSVKRSFTVGFSFSIRGPRAVFGTDEIEVEAFSSAEAIYRAEAVARRQNPDRRIGPQFYVKALGGAL